MLSSALPLAIFNFSGQEIFLVFLIVLLLFGGAKLPSLARGLGQSIKEFKKAAREDEPEHPPGESKSDPKKPGNGGTPG